MGKNLAGKSAFIVAVLVIFCFGIVGIPHGSLAQSIKDRIHLGLDLKGGTHLVLEVHVAEAVGSATDRDVARIEDAFQKAKASATTVARAGGRTLGELSYASVDTFDNVRPMSMAGAMMRMNVAGAAPPPTEEFTPQTISVTAHVNALFTLK